MDLGVAGRVAIVTGASRGIGRATAERLCREGASVAPCARNRESLGGAQRALEALGGGRVLAIEADLTEPAAAARIDRDEVHQLGEMFRGLDVTPSPAAVRKYIDRDRYFHWRLVEIAGNEQLSAAMGSVNMMFFAYQDGVVRPAAETVKEHWDILEVLCRRDPDASEAAMRLHIRRSVERLEQEAEAEEAEAE
jgi:NAD(P)-dependent dehydrogenase (short-subunit alcohol dehydrogenase family)